MLNGFVDVTTRNTCENTCSYLNFTLECTYYCILYVSDVTPLMVVPKELSNHLMDWFRIWYNSQIKDPKFYVVSPYLLQTLQAWIKDKYGEGYQSFALFFKTKCKRYLSKSDSPTLIVPYLFAKHWSVFILSEDDFKHFNSMWAVELHEHKYVHTYLAKLWATWRGFEVESTE